MELSTTAKDFYEIIRSHDYMPSYCPDQIGLFWCDKNIRIYINGELAAFNRLDNLSVIVCNEDCLSANDVDKQDFINFMNHIFPDHISSFRNAIRGLFDNFDVLRFVIGFTTDIGGWFYDGSCLKFGKTVMARYEHDQLTIYSAALNSHYSAIHSAFEAVYGKTIPVSIYGDFESDISLTISYGQTLYMLYMAVSTWKDCGVFTIKGDTLLYKGIVLYNRTNNVLNERLCMHENWYVSDIKKIINMEDPND